MIDPGLLAKLQGLLSLAKGSHSPEEAATAFAQAQRLATKHSLDLAALETQATKEECKAHRALSFGKRYQAWEVMLANAICQVNDCAFLLGREGGNRIGYIVGRKSDARIVGLMLDPIADQIYLMTPPGNGLAWSNRFREGCVYTVARRLREGKAAQAAGTSAAMVLANRAEEANKLCEALADQETKALGQDGEGTLEGMMAGHSVRLNKELDR